METNLQVFLHAHVCFLCRTWPCSQWAAQRGAKAVQLTYDKFADGDAPLLSIADALRARSFYQLPRALPFAPSGTTYGSNNSYLKSGGVDVDDILTAAGAPTAAALTLAAFGIGGDGAAVPVAVAIEPPCPTRHVRVVSGRYGTPSQLHFYMETQNAVAWPDEDGCVVVHSSCQGCDYVQVCRPKGRWSRFGPVGRLEVK